MVLNDRLELQLWASEFFLTERIPEHIMDPDTPWDDFDAWIGDHIATPFENFTGSEVWDLIAELANYTYATRGKQS